MADKFHEECGLFAVVGDPSAVSLTACGLQALQHRGQDSAGIAWRNGGTLRDTKVMGHARQLMAEALDTMSASVAIGHVRYATCGTLCVENAQPVVSGSAGGDIALCHNGHVINVDDLRAELAPRHDRVDEMSDTAVITCRFGERFAGDVESSVRLTFEAVKGAYSVLILTPNGVAALRDPFGIRPLSLGRKGTATIISSETCAIDAVGGNLVRDVEPGELLLLNEGTVRSTTFQRAHAWPAQCIFELVYFARPDSVVFGHAVASVRMALGRQLAREAPAMADIVVPIPESAVYAALGYAQESGIDYSMALFRNGFVGRSFIEPDPPVRNLAVRTKLNPVKGLVQGRRVVLVDDSIVRGNTCGQVVAKLRQAGAREVHVRVASPPTVASCYFGVDTPDVRELFAVGRGIAEMRQALDADSLQFLSLEGLMHAVGLDARRFCSACFSGVYPLDVSRMPRRWHAPLRCA